MGLLVVKIQRSSFYDGPGIRTTVFIKGCSLRCPWCCNPECMLPSVQFYFDKGKCLKTKDVECGECIRVCPISLLKSPENIIEINNDNSLITRCLSCRNCIRSCPTSAIGIYGKEFEVEELVEMLKNDKDFYVMSGGGVTFSGGEPLLHAKELAMCLKELKKLGIHTCIETYLFCILDCLDLVKEFVNLFIIDIKVLNPNECKKYLGGDLQTYLKNVEIVLQSQKFVIFRFLCVKPVTFNKSNIKLLCDFLGEWKIGNLEIFSIHNFSTKKYESLGRKPLYFEEINKGELEFLKKKISALEIEVKILDI